MSEPFKIIAVELCLNYLINYFLLPIAYPSQTPNPKTIAIPAAIRNLMRITAAGIIT